MNSRFPCNPDHNGECLKCDCWIDDCAFDRWKNKVYLFETEEELNEMFKEYDKTEDK